MKNSNKKTNYSSTPAITCHVAPMPMKEVYQHMADDVAKAMCALRGAKSSKEVRNILSKIYQYQVDSRVAGRIASMIEDIKWDVHAMHMYDYTRSNLCEDMEVVLDALHDEIAAEEHQQDIEGARELFLLMADNAEALVDWFNQMKQKDMKQEI